MEPRKPSAHASLDRYIFVNTGIIYFRDSYQDPINRQKHKKTIQPCFFCTYNTKSTGQIFVYSFFANFIMAPRIAKVFYWPINLTNRGQLKVIRLCTKIEYISVWIQLTYFLQLYKIKEHFSIRIVSISMHVNSAL